MITVSDVSYVYKNGVRALHGVSMEAQPGETLCVLGHNGAGKSTLMRTFNGLLRPNSGSVVVNGVDVASLRPAQAAALVGVCFQNPDSQLFCPTVLEEVRFGARNGGADAQTVDERVNEALFLLGLDSVRESNPYSLSLSLRKRVAIASVVAMRTPTLVLDEPTGNLDRHGSQLVSELIGHLAAQGRTVVVVTHDIDLAQDHADHVAVLKVGTVHLSGRPAAVFGDSRLIDAGILPPTLYQLGRHLGVETPSTDALTTWVAGQRTAKREI